MPDLRSRNEPPPEAAAATSAHRKTGRPWLARKGGTEPACDRRDASARQSRKLDSRPNSGENSQESRTAELALPQHQQQLEATCRGTSAQCAARQGKVPSRGRWSRKADPEPDMDSGRTTVRNVRSKCRCSSVLQFTLRRAVSCVLHRSSSQVIHCIELCLEEFLGTAPARA